MSEHTCRPDCAVFRRCGVPIFNYRTCSISNSPYLVLGHHAIVGEPGKQNIHVNIVIVELDERHIRILNCLAIAHAIRVLEQLKESAKKILSRDMARDNAQRVNIAIASVHAQSIRTKSVDLAAERLVQVDWDFLFFGNALDKGLDQLVQFGENFKWGSVL